MKANVHHSRIHLCLMSGGHAAVTGGLTPKTKANCDKATPYHSNSFTSDHNPDLFHLIYTL